MRRLHLRRTAHHEAGHAVAYLAFGHEFIEVVIDPKPRPPRDDEMSGSNLGWLLPKRGWPLPDIEEAICRLAGPAAEARYRRCAIPYTIGVGNDRAMAKRYLTNSQYTFRTAEDFARQVVRDNWPSVQRLADALVTHHRIDYQTALTIVGDTIRPRLDAKPTVRARPKLTWEERQQAKRTQWKREWLARPRLF
jgi:hypothetical protein